MNSKILNDAAQRSLFWMICTRVKRKCTHGIAITGRFSIPRGLCCDIKNARPHDRHAPVHGEIHQCHFVDSKAKDASIIAHTRASQCNWHVFAIQNTRAGITGIKHRRHLACNWHSIGASWSIVTCHSVIILTWMRKVLSANSFSPHFASDVTLRC